MNKFYFKIIIPSIISILFFILTIFFFIIPQFQNNIMNGKREMIKELTNSAWSILSKYENDERNGLLTREEAQKTAISRIQYLRYGEEGKDYFWITDMHPNMVMHPYRPDLNTKDLTNFSDPHGKKLFVEFVNTVKESDYGYVDYMWQWKDDSLHIVPKLSFVKIFKPWGWVIGTGIYIEDVKKEIKALTNKLLWISIGITLIIGFLLVFISQQSLNIEKKRAEAKKELQLSKEKYKTLVEAATEGILMISDGRISYSNNIISKMTGFNSEELFNKEIDQIIINNNILLNKMHKEGVFETTIKKKDGSFADVLVTSSSTIFYDKFVNIITVKDVSVEGYSNLSNLDYQKLLNTLNIGLFKAIIDAKGRFISANEQTIRILGFTNFNELSKTYILELLTNKDDKKSLRNQLIEARLIKNKIIKIRKSDNKVAIISVTLVVINNDNTKEIICDGIIEDITLREEEKAQTEGLISNLKHSSFILENPITDYIKPIHSIDINASIKSGIKKMQTQKTDYLIITKNENDFIGIVTKTDIQNRVLLLNLDLENPLYLIMSAPIAFINSNLSIGDAIRKSEQHSINHLMVKNDSNEAIGCILALDLYKSLKNSLHFWTGNINKSQNKEELKHCYSSLQLLIKPLIKSEASTKHITQITSSFSDSITQRIIELAIEEMGKPPVNFAFISLGSEGRKEETLYTDQDNAIIFDNVDKDNLGEISAYFNKLSDYICDTLNDVGYSYCKGKVMAKNQQWCQSLDVWKTYFRNWIATPEPQNLLDATIFFDFRKIYGDDRLTDQLRKSILDYMQQQPLFIYHLAYNTYSIKLQQISSNSLISDKNIDLIDLKNALNIIIMFARAYTLQNNIWQTNTLDRLNALKNEQIVIASTIDEIIYVYDFLMMLRFRVQVELLEENQPISNQLNTKNIIEIEYGILKKALTTLQLIQTKIGTEFRITL
jgi:PAS domain S-box-containing protein